jgi:hypothetical protein
MLKCANEDCGGCAPDPARTRQGVRATRPGPCSAAPPRVDGGSLSGAIVRRWVHAACDALDEASILAISLCAAAPYLCPKHRSADPFTLPGGEESGALLPRAPGSPEPPSRARRGVCSTPRRSAHGAGACG